MTETVSFGEIFELERHPVEIDLSEKYTQIGIRSYGNGIFHRPAVTGNELSKLKYFHVYRDRIIFSNIMAWEGAVALSGPDEDGTVGSQRFLSYRPTTDKVDLRYINYFFQSERGVELVRDGSTGSVKRNQTLSPKTIERFDLPLPDLAEQRRIVQVLDHGIARCRVVREARDELEAALRSSLLRHAFETEPSQHPFIDDVMALARRPVTIDPLRTYEEIGVRSFGRGIFHKQPVSGTELGNKKVFEIHPGELVFNTVFAWEGAVAITSNAEQGKIGSHRFMTYKVNHELADLRYLQYFFQSEPGLQILGAASPGGAGRNRTLGIKAFGRQRIPLPDLAKQRAIRDRLDTAFRRPSALMERRKKLEEALKPALLNAAFSGQL